MAPQLPFFFYLAKRLGQYCSGEETSGETTEINTYVKISSLSDLTDGAKYILVGECTKTSTTTYYAMGASTSTSPEDEDAVRSAVSVTVTNNVCDISSVTGVNPFTLETGSVDGTYAIKLLSGNYIYFTSSDGQKNLKETTSISEKAFFTLTFDPATGQACLVNSYYIGRGLKFYYNDSTNAQFTNNDITKADQVFGYLYKQQEVKETSVETPIFSEASGLLDSGKTVTISCKTEGATIYYTTDGTEPTERSTQYTEGTNITITATTTLKAIAVKDDLTSNVASATYTVAISLKEANQLNHGQTFTMKNELVVVYTDSDDYTYVYESPEAGSSDGTFSLLPLKINSAKALSILNSGWSGTMKYVDGLLTLVPSTTTTINKDKSYTGKVPTVDFAASTGYAKVYAQVANAHKYVRVRNVSFAKETPKNAETFQGSISATNSSTSSPKRREESETKVTLTFNNVFGLASQNAGLYDVICFVATNYSADSGDTDKTVMGSSVQLYPVEYLLSTLGISDIEAEDVLPVYYNLQGVRVENPENGVFIEVRGNRATKVVK